MINDIAFAFVALSIAIAAFFVVTCRDLVRAVLWFTVALLAIAALYAMLDAPFLSGVQVLTYVGGVATLMIFGVMLTRRHAGGRAEADNASKPIGALAAVAMFALMATAILKTDLTATTSAPARTTREVAHALFDEQLLAFEVLSLLLLAAIVGAVVLARRRDPVSDASEASATRADRTAETE